MSQSDYIKHKRTSNELRINELPNLLEYNHYNSYKGYSLENTIINTKIRYNQLIPSGRIDIWNMEKTVSNCSTFIICRNTHTRSNKKTYPLNYNETYCNIHPTRPLSIKEISLLTQNNTCRCLQF